MRHIKEYKQALNESKEQEDLNTQLRRAARNGYLRDVKDLLDRGADPNARDMRRSTPLYGAASSGHTEIVRLLIDRGADANAMNKYGMTPLHYATSSGRAETAKLLIDRGADPFKAFEDPQKIFDFFNGDIEWMPEGDAKRRLKLMKRSKKMFGM